VSALLLLLGDGAASVGVPVHPLSARSSTAVQEHAFHDHHVTWRDRDGSCVNCLVRAVVEGRYDEFAWTPRGGLLTVAT
jgi:hypothetical protein